MDWLKEQLGLRTPYPSGQPRSVRINAGDPHKLFKGNYVSTTKYNVVTYLPKALFEQFRRVANVYFAIVAGLSCLSISPVSPATTFAPLGLVLGVSMIKEALEDVKRWLADREVNARPVLVYSPSAQKFVSKAWKELKVGEIIQVDKDSFFPADLLLLSVPESPEGICYVETINLDGESNLKIKKGLEQTKELEQLLGTFTAELQCEQPNASLYTFTGNLLLTPPLTEAAQTVPLSPASILLRGSSLRNTKRVLGVVVFAGHETKVMMNATLPPSKRSRVEREMDILILFMFALLLAMCIIGAAFFAAWTHSRSPNMWYLRPDDDSNGATDPNRPGVVAGFSFVTSFILYGYLIPISLYVSLEMVKVFQSLVYIGKDRKMYHKESDTPAQARTSNLNEELGMVNTILSDKTGTLTRNVMEFFKCSIAGVAYGQGVTEIERASARRLGQPISDVEDPAAVKWKSASFNFYDKRLLGGAWQQEEHPEHIRQFMRVLAVCHTVIPDGPEDPDQIEYEAESPDESALVAAAKVFGFFFHKRRATTVLVRETQTSKVTEVEYEILNILEFDSTRKRMSVICRSSEGKLWLYCKGADTVIYERLAATHPLNAQLKVVTRDHMEEFGSAGLRTLCLAYAELDPAEYDKWQQQFFAAKTALTGRDEKLAAAGELIERDLILLGCTAIEDKLQQGVPECIERLANAGIRIWVLTGDKQETAINIGFACSLLRTDMTQYIISANVPEVVSLEDQGNHEQAFKVAHAAVQEQLADALKHMLMQGQDTDMALIIDGKALIHGLADDTKARLLEVGQKCAAVVCCRVSPKQKALVTALVKSAGDTTLGIGDGANDVGMIQEAHIGVGISGQEGMQAVMSSDFSIAQFRFLESLLLVHGRYSYLRISRMVAFFFYKNLLFGLTIFFYNTLCFFSGQTIYNDFYMSLYNVVFSALVPLIVGTMDVDVSKEMSRKYPGLYQVGPRNAYFDLRAMVGWLLNATYQAVVIFVMTIIAYRPIYADRHSGTTFSHWQTGATLFTAVLLTIHLEITSVIDRWTWLHHLAVEGSIFLWFLYMIVWGEFPLGWSQDLYELFIEVLATSAQFWLFILVAPFVCVLPGYFFRQMRRHLRPDDKHIVAEIESMVTCGALARVKSMHPDAGPLSPKLMRPSMGLTVCCNTGYVPHDAPGAMSFFTPRHSVMQCKQAFGQDAGSQRNPVVANLDASLRRNPLRHHRSSKMLTLEVQPNKAPKGGRSKSPDLKAKSKLQKQGLDTVVQTSPANPKPQPAETIPAFNIDVSAASATQSPGAADSPRSPATKALPGLLEAALQGENSQLGDRGSGPHDGGGQLLPLPGSAASSTSTDASAAAPAPRPVRTQLPMQGSGPLPPHLPQTQTPPALASQQQPFTDLGVTPTTSLLSSDSTASQQPPPSACTRLGRPLRTASQDAGKH